jgi:hypothetical protein
MKRLFMVLTVLALSLCLATAALARGVAVPKNLCLLMNDGYDGHLVLIIKSMGAVNTKDGVVKYYSVLGEQFYAGSTLRSVPMSGTGHVNSSGSFHFSINGTALNDGSGQDGFTYSVFIEGKYGLTSSTGTYSMQWFAQNAPDHFTGVGNFTPTDCKNEVIPY